jgi:molybdate transport system substrate-binding protein
VIVCRVLGALLGSIAMAASAGAQPSEVFVSAAVSLTESLERAARLYEASSGDRVVLNLAASNTLARQIRAGARVDVFISADERQMDAVAAEIVPGSRTNLLSNRLAVVVPAGAAHRLSSVTDLTAPAIRRVAVGDSSAVPAGVYARQYLESVKLWRLLEPKLVPFASVRLALAAVENGVADAGIVYRTDVAASERVRLAFTVPESEGPAIVYPAAILRSGANPAGARRFLTFLRRPEAAALFRQAGFVPIG